MEPPVDQGRLPEGIANMLYPYQVPHVEALGRAQDAGRDALLDGSGTGLGKTTTAAALCAWKGLSAFIIAPLSVLIQWFTTMARFDVNIIGAINYESLKNGKYYTTVEDCHRGAKKQCPYIKIGYQTKARGGSKTVAIDDFEWQLPENTLIIFDEAHRGKNGFGSNKTVNNTLVASSRAALNRQKRIFLLMLSATITDKLENTDFLTYTLGMYKPYTRQAASRFAANLQRLAGQDGKSPLVKLHELIFPAMGAIMPPLDLEIARQSQIRARVYHVSKEVAEEIEALHREIRRLLAEIRAKGPSVGFGSVIRAWMQMELLKVPVAVDVVLRKLRKGFSVSVFLNFNESRKQMHDMLLDLAGRPENADIFGGENGRAIMADKIVHIHGGQSIIERGSQIAKFQGDRAWVALVNIRAGGVGVSLHDVLGARPRRPIVFPTWAAIDLVQTFGRSVRAGMRTIVKQRVIYCTDANVKKSSVPERIDEPITANLDAAIPVIPTVDATPQEDNRVPPNVSLNTSIEVMLCNIVSAKLDNISMLNTGHVAVLVEDLVDDGEDIELEGLEPQGVATPEV